MLQRLKFNIKDLVNEMLDQLPKEVFQSKITTFYDPFVGGGQFVIEVENRLRQYGHSDENISKRVFGYVGNRIRLNYIMNTHKLVGNYKTNIIEDMKFDVVLGNPPYQETLGASRGKPIWDKFVLKSYSLLKPKGYLSLIHPGSWRAPKGKFKPIQKIYKENNLIFLKISDYKQGQKTFGVATNYDYFLLQNTPNQGKTHLIDSEGNSDIIDISLLEFIPNSQLSLYNKLIAKPKEERVQLLRDSSYHSARDYVSDTQNGEFKYPVIWSITQKKGINLRYSKINNRGHFNQPKVAFSNGGGSYPVIDSTGEFGLTEFGFGIVDSISNLKNIQKALENPHFISLMKSAGFRNMKYEPKVIETFRKDFWKEFIK